MSNPYNQHFLPRVFLRGFCDSKGQIYFYDKDQNEIKGPRNTKSVAAKKHLYTIKDGEKNDYRVEEFFGKIEDRSAPLLKRIQIEGLHSLQFDEVLQIMSFLTFTFVRTPAHVSLAEQVIRDVDVQADMLAKDELEAKKYIEDCMYKSGLSFAEMLPHSFEYRLEMFRKNFDIHLQTAKQSDTPPLILNDRFLCAESIDRQVHYLGDDVDWNKMNIKLHFPVTSKDCLSLITRPFNRKGTTKVQITKEELTLNNANVINALAFTQLERYGYCHAVETLRKLQQDDSKEGRVN